MSDSADALGGGRPRQTKSPMSTSADKVDGEEHDEDDFDMTDNESMFDMFTGEIHNPDSRENTVVDDTRSEVSWEGVEEYEYTKFDVDMRLAERDFVYLPKPPSSVSTVETAKDIRALNAEATEVYRWKSSDDRCAVYLLDMLPETDPSDPIQAQMKMSGRVNYWAVSHCASPSSNEASSYRTKSIPCDGKIIQVTPKVYDMLQRIRNLMDKGEWTEFTIRPCVWVDSVCIDPDSTTQHAEHVYRAADIFRNAQGTIIDLGDDAYEFSALCVAAEALWTARKADATSINWPAGVLERKAAVEITQNLLSHPWFSQRSIIQEFAANKRRAVVCGNSAIRFDALYHLVCFLDLLPSLGPLPYVAQMDSLWPRTWLFANLYRHRFSPPSSHPVPHILSFTCNCKTRDPFADAHRRPDELPFRPKQLPWCGRTSCGAKTSPECSEPDRWLYIDLAHSYARENSTTAVLALAAAFPCPPDSPLRLPSWVPDWDAAHARPELPPAIQSYIDGELACPAMRHVFSSRGEKEVWGFPPVGKSPGEPLETSGMCVEIRRNTRTGGILRVRGWILERPQKGTRVAAMDWESWSAYPGASVNETQGLKWKSEKVRFLKERGERVRVMDIGEGWNHVRQEELVLFVPCCELMFVLKQVSGGNTFRLVRSLRRTVVIDKPRFVFVDRVKEEVWAYGHLSRPPHVLDLV